MVTINPAKQLRDRQPRRLARGRQGRRRRHLEPPSAQLATPSSSASTSTARVYYDRRADERRLTALQKEKSSLAVGRAGRRRVRAVGEPAGTARRRARQRPGGPPARRASRSSTGTSGARRCRRRRARRSRPRPERSRRSPTRAFIRSRRPDIERGTIVIRGSMIEAIGANVAVPAGAKVVDAAGADVYPGFINARTQMGLNEPGPRGFEDVNEMLDVNPQLRTRVAYHAESDAIPVARANGITTVARHAGRRHVRRRGRGDEPRRLDVGRGDAPAERGHHVHLPGARRRRRARGRRRAAAPRRPNAPTRN